MRVPTIVITFTIGASLLFASPARAESGRPVGDTRVFAVVPDPGQPAGIAVDGERVLVTTLGLGTQPLTDPALFTFRLAAGTLRNSATIPRMMPASVMALYGVATDAAGNAYVVDMNGRIAKVTRDGVQETYAEFPPQLGGMATMPFDIAFGPDGTAYVTDQNLAGIWRVPPGGGEAQMWFQDPRLASYLFGPTGIRFDPSGQHLYFSVAISAFPGTPGNALIYRIPVNTPTADRLEEFFRYPARSSAFGIAFGASGKLYVALAGPSQISILRPDGTEEMRFPSAEQNSAQPVPYDRPLGLAFDGRGSLLVTNSTNALSPPNSARWVIFDAYVNDTAAPHHRPVLTPRTSPAPADRPGAVGSQSLRPANEPCSVGRAAPCEQGVLASPDAPKSDRRAEVTRPRPGTSGAGGTAPDAPLSGSRALAPAAVRLAAKQGGGLFLPLAAGLVGAAVGSCWVLRRRITSHHGPDPG